MNKKIGGIVVGVLVLVGVSVGLFVSQKKPQVVEQTKKTDELGAIPTVDSSTTVTLVAQPGNKEMILKSAGIPKDTSSVDYELSYDTKGQGKQGVIGTISTIENNGFEKQMTLGTCSSGRCVYHEVVGAIQVTLRFTGEYGEKVLSKEFEL